jgi:hypothetical protein
LAASGLCATTRTSRAATVGGAAVGIVRTVGLAYVTMLDILALAVPFTFHIFKRSRVARERHALWVTLLVAYTMITAPVYWYLHVWRRPIDDGQ